MATTINEGDGSSSGRRAHNAAISISRFRAAFMSAFSGARWRRLPARGGCAAMGSRVTGTLFGRRRGHIFLSFHNDLRQPPVLLLELSTPTGTLVREMASGLVRIALECDAAGKKTAAPPRRLLEEPIWRTFCNGRKCGYAVKREWGPEEKRVLAAVEPISMGAGVLPALAGEEDGEVMYMRAKFERVVGSKDSEAFYMMNPDGNGGPELSIYLLRA